MHDVYGATKKNTDDVKSTEKNRSRLVILYTPILPAVHHSCIVDMQTNVATLEEMRDGENGERNADSLKSSRFTAVSSVSLISCFQEKKSGPCHSGAEPDPSGGAYSNRGRASVACSFRRYAPLVNRHIASAGGVRNEVKSRQ
jgi:hypothetical protein